MRDFVTVVSGVPRSGTSLMMQMLRAGGLPLLADDHRLPDEDNPRGYFEYAPVKASARDVSWIAEATGCAVKVIHALLRHLPGEVELRIILMERNLEEVLASQRAMMERGGAAPADDRGLAVGFADQLEVVRVWAVERPRTPLLHVGYRDAVERPIAVAQRVDAFLAGGLDVSAMIRAVDPALYRKRL